MKISSPSCPACREPFIDETGEFSICRDCPYRIAPKTAVEVAKDRRVCGRDCLYPSDNIVRRSKAYCCTRCPYGRLAKGAATQAGAGFETVYKVPRVDWKAKYLKLRRDYNELLRRSDAL